LRRSQIAVGDFNGDGWLDAATANPEPGRASVFRNGRVWPHLDAPSLTVGGVPLAELRAALTCGVAAVDLRSGQSVG
jgi:hypothetical protein